MELCAIKDCPNPGKAQICPYDGKFHHHGLIHYDCHFGRNPVIHSVLQFREGGWYAMCDEHYTILKAELETWHKQQSKS